MALWFDKRYKTYRFVWRENGRQRMMKLGKDRKAAELKARELQRKIDLGEHAPMLVRTTIAEHAAWFAEYHLTKKRPETRRAYGFSLKKMAEFFECEKIIYLDQVTRGLWERFEREILSRFSAETRNDIFNVLSVFLNQAVANRSLMKNPLVGVPRRRKNPHRRLPKVFSDEEIAGIRAAADAELLPAIDLMLLTGLRRREVWALDWDDVDFKNRVLTIQAKADIGFSPKNYELRSIDLSDQALELLRAITHGDRFVISHGLERPALHIDTLGKKFKRVCKKAGLAEGALHSLRRTYATRLQRMGAPSSYIQHVLGHESLETTEKYLNPGGDYSRRLGQALQYPDLATNPAQAILKQKSNG